MNLAVTAHAQMVDEHQRCIERKELASACLSCLGANESIKYLCGSADPKMWMRMMQGKVHLLEGVRSLIVQFPSTAEDMIKAWNPDTVI